MKKSLSEMSLEELWQLFPIVLTEHQVCWKDWFMQEQEALSAVLPSARISHVGSTAIETIWAKPIVDMLAEIPSEMDFAVVKRALVAAGYICMNQSADRMSFNKGYTADGFAERVFHLHVRRKGDHDELYFRDYLREHPEVAAAYQRLKLDLWKAFEHDRDGYTEAKAEFVKQHTEKARAAYGDRYEQG